MPMKNLCSLCISLVAACTMISSSQPAGAQVPYVTRHSISPPLVGAQADAQLGYSVAVEGGFAIAGAPFDDTGAADSGLVKVFDSTTGALLFVIPNPTPDNGDGFGVSVAISGTKVVVGAYRDDAIAANSGTAYVYDLSGATPTVPLFALNNPSPAADDHFGQAVAISGNRLVVGAPQDDSVASNSGSAYVYDLSSASPTIPQTTLNNPAPAGGDLFGASVTISGNLLAVGASSDDAGAVDEGSVYIYDLSSGTPSVPMRTLNNPSPAAGDNFGVSVALSGTRVAVGANLDDASASDSGSAYVYDLSSGTPGAPVATLTNPSPAVGDGFGNTVAISGTRVVVGASLDDAGVLDSGRAYVYDLSSGFPTAPIATVNNPTPGLFDGFGASVAISGSAVLVGANLDGTVATKAGSAYLYDFSIGLPLGPKLTLNTPSLASGDKFGNAVSVSGNLMVVGVPFDDSLAENSGSAYVYDLASGTPTLPIFALRNPSPAAQDQYGVSVSISGTRIVVGAAGDDTGVSNSGSAYVYDLSSADPGAPVVVLNNPVPAVSASFGRSVAISGSRVVVGAYGNSTGASRTGSAYVYDLTSGSPATPVATLNNPSPAPDDAFGYSVAVSGTLIVVGAYMDDAGATNAGSAYVYNLTSGTPTVPVATLLNPTPAGGDFFGAFVAISGTRVVVTAPYDNTGASDAGSAYVYDTGSGTPTEPVATLNNPAPTGSELFGITASISGPLVAIALYQDSGVTVAYRYDLASASPTIPTTTLTLPSSTVLNSFAFQVAIDGHTIAVGAPFDDTVIADKGYVYVFRPEDATTTPPTLVEPADNTWTKSPISVNFTLPEEAQPGSVKLQIGTTTLTLAASQETAGTHSFTFNPASPLTAPQIASILNGPLRDGNYTVTLSYQDAFGNPAASDASTAVVVDTITRVPVFAAPVAGSTQGATIRVGYSLLEAAMPGSVKLSFGSYVLNLSSLGEVTGNPGVSFTFDPRNPTASPYVASGVLIPDGVYTVTISYQDKVGNGAAKATRLNVTVDAVPSVPLATGAYFVNNAVPAAGTDARIASGAVWTGFGPPAISDTGAVAYAGKWKATEQSGAGIFVNDTLVVKVGETVPGAGSGGIPADATFKSFKDPVIDDGGHVAFLAAVKGTGVAPANDTVVVSNGRTGTLEVLAREGDVAPGTGGAVFKGFTSVSIKGAAIGGTLFTASLLPGAGVTSANDTGAWWLPAGQTSPIKLVREGDAGFLEGETIKSFLVLKALGGSPSQGRGQRGSDGALIQLSLTGGVAPRQVQVLAQPNTLTEYTGTGDLLGGAALPTAAWKTMNLPSFGNFGANISVLGTLTNGVGGVATPNGKGVFLSDDSGATWEPLVRTDDAAPGLGAGAVFAGFKDPVNSSTGAAVAFFGAAKGGTVLAANNDGIWYSPDGAALNLIAREGALPPGAPANSQWKSFASVAQPGGTTGPLFTAMLQKGTPDVAHPSGITSINDFALYGTTSLGTVFELLRENQPLLGKTVKSFNVLKAISGSAGASRSFNSNGQVVALVSFTDGSTGIVRLDVP